MSHNHSLLLSLPDATPPTVAVIKHDLKPPLWTCKLWWCGATLWLDYMSCSIQTAVQDVTTVMLTLTGCAPLSARTSATGCRRACMLPPALA